MHDIVQAAGLHQARKLDAAERMYRRILADQPAHGDALHLLGTLKAELGAYREGIALIRRAIAASRRAEYYANLWSALQLGGAAPDDEAAHRAAAALMPGHPAVHAGLGGACLAHRRLEAAEAAWRRAAVLAPEQAESRINLGVVLRARGRLEEAAAACARALALDPGHPVATLNLAGIRQEQGRMADAAPLVRRALALSADVSRTVDVMRRRIARYGRDALLPVAADGSALTSPLRLRVEPSSACNLRCRHCTTGVAYGSTDRRLMSPATFERVLEDAARLAHLLDCVLYLGGEPLLNPRFAEMCRRIKDGTAVGQTSFVTNGMLLDEAKCRELAAAGISFLEVSIDGRSPEENDALRRGASYAVLREKVRMLARYLRESGTTIRIANTIVRRPGDPPDPETPRFLTDDFPDLPVQTHYAMRWPGWTDAPDSPTLEVVARPERARKFCALPFIETAVRANGDVTLCCYDISGLEVMGNVADASIETIWNGEKYRRIRLAMIAGDEEALPEVCRRCAIFSGAELLDGA